MENNINKVRTKNFIQNNMMMNQMFQRKYSASSCNKEFDYMLKNYKMKMNRKQCLTNGSIMKSVLLQSIYNHHVNQSKKNITLNNEYKSKILKSIGSDSSTSKSSTTDGCSSNSKCEVLNCKLLL